MHSSYGQPSKSPRSSGRAAASAPAACWAAATRSFSRKDVSGLHLHQYDKCSDQPGPAAYAAYDRTQAQANRNEFPSCWYQFRDTAHADTEPDTGTRQRRRCSGTKPLILGECGEHGDWSDQKPYPSIRICMRCSCDKVYRSSSPDPA
jgi:hypothetical protein